MANVLFVKCTVTLPDYPTPKAKYDSITPHDAGTFYLVGKELYLGDVFLSADIAAEIGVEDVAEYFTGTTVEAVLAELYEAQNAKKIYVVEDSTSVDYAKVYSLYQGTGTAADPVVAEKVADINIPKDLVVKEGSVVDIVFVEGTGGDPDTLHEGSASGPDVTELIVGTTGTPTEADAGKYIKLVIANRESTPLYIAAKDLVDIYRGGTTAEATVAIDANNVITVTINKIDATKVIYTAASEAVYTADPTVDATNFDAKVADPGLYTEAGGVYTKVQAGDTFDPSATYYVLTTPAVEEETIKHRVDYVEDKVDDLSDYVGEIPPTSQATDVIGYVDEQTQGGVGALNGEAGVASKSSGDVVTIKGSVIEVAGIIQNGPSAAEATVVNGYLNPTDGKFYEEATYETEITPADNTSYKDVPSDVTYNWTGAKYVPITPDVTLAKAAVTGASEDVSYDNTTSGMTADDVQEAIDEIAGRLTWNEV